MTSDLLNFQMLLQVTFPTYNLYTKMTKCKLSVSCHSVFQHNGRHTQNGRCL